MARAACTNSRSRRLLTGRDALLRDRHHGDDEQQDRQAQKEVGDPGDDTVGPAPGISGDEAQRHTDEGRDTGGDEADDERGSRPDGPAGEEVTAQARLDTEPVGRADSHRGEAVEVDELGVHGVRIRLGTRDRVDGLQRVEQRGEERDEDEEDDDDRAEDRDLVLLEAVPGDAAGRAPGAHLTVGRGSQVLVALGLLDHLLVRGLDDRFGTGLR